MPNPKLKISESVIQATQAFIRKRNFLFRVETFVYWAGVTADSDFLVTTLIAPKAKETRGSFIISPKANSDVISYVCRNGLRVFAQVHTHPGSWVEHSDGDEMGASFAYNDFYSIVLPDYGLADFKISKWGVHRFENGKFRLLQKQEALSAIEIIPVTVNFRALC